MPEDAPWGMPQARCVGQAALMSLRGRSGPLGDVGVSASSPCCWACPAGPAVNRAHRAAVELGDP